MSSNTATSRQYGQDGSAATTHQPPAMQQSSSYSTGTSGNALPGALQPGNGPNRLPPSTSNTASTTAPTSLTISTQMAQSNQQSRPPMSQSHAHSRSSPAGLEQQRYKQYGATPENSKYTSPPSSGYQPQTPAASKYSPLGLADIRPQTESGIRDQSLTSGSSSFGGMYQAPTNSNYVAPWPIYAVDWCKWPISSSSPFTGKVAIGSYLEDNHNYVRRITVVRKLFSEHD